MNNTFEDPFAEFDINEKTYQGMENVNHFQRQQSSQGSLSRCAELQAREREKIMLDFMETDINIEEYLQGLGPIEDGEFDLEEDDPKKKMNFHSQQVALYEQYHQYHGGEHLFPEGESVPSSSYYPPPAPSSIPAHDPLLHLVKREPEDDDEGQSESSSLTGSQYGRRATKVDAASALAAFHPQTKARRYTLKPEEEKEKPSYKLKRARNNDAVRRSRNKAKEVQMHRDHENNLLKKKIAELEKMLKDANTENASLKSRIHRYEGNR